MKIQFVKNGVILSINIRDPPPTSSGEKKRKKFVLTVKIKLNEVCS